MNYKIIAYSNYNLFEFYREIKNNPSQAPAMVVKAINANLKEIEINPNLLNTIISQAIMGAPLQYEEIVEETIKEFPDKYKEILSASIKIATVIDPFAHLTIFFVAIDVLNNLSRPYTWQNLFDAIDDKNAPENDPIRELFKNKPQ